MVQENRGFKWLDIILFLYYIPGSHSFNSVQRSNL